MFNNNNNKNVVNFSLIRNRIWLHGVKKNGFRAPVVPRKPFSTKWKFVATVTDLFTGNETIKVGVVYRGGRDDTGSTRRIAGTGSTQR